MERVKQDQVIDLEQFRAALDHALLSIRSEEKRGEIYRLTAMIDGQPNVRSSSEHSSEVAAELVTDDKPILCDLCRVRDGVRSDDDGIQFCQECWDGWRESWKPINYEVE